MVIHEKQAMSDGHRLLDGSEDVGWAHQMKMEKAVQKIARHIEKLDEEDMSPDHGRHDKAHGENEEDKKRIESNPAPKDGPGRIMKKGAAPARRGALRPAHILEDGSEEGSGEESSESSADEDDQFLNFDVQDLLEYPTDEFDIEASRNTVDSILADFHTHERGDIVEKLEEWFQSTKKVAISEEDALENEENQVSSFDNDNEKCHDAVHEKLEQTEMEKFQVLNKFWMKLNMRAEKLSNRPKKDNRWKALVGPGWFNRNISGTPKEQAEHLKMLGMTAGETNFLQLQDKLSQMRAMMSAEGFDPTKDGSLKASDLLQVIAAQQDEVASLRTRVTMNTKTVESWNAGLRWIRDGRPKENLPISEVLEAIEDIKETLKEKAVADLLQGNISKASKAIQELAQLITSSINDHQQQEYAEICSQIQRECRQTQEEIDRLMGTVPEDLAEKLRNWQPSEETAPAPTKKGGKANKTNKKESIAPKAAGRLSGRNVSSERDGPAAPEPGKSDGSVVPAQSRSAWEKAKENDPTIQSYRKLINQSNTMQSKIEYQADKLIDKIDKMHRNAADGADGGDQERTDGYVDFGENLEPLQKDLAQKQKQLKKQRTAHADIAEVSENIEEHLLTIRQNTDENTEKTMTCRMNTEKYRKEKEQLLKKLEPEGAANPAQVELDGVEKETVTLQARVKELETMISDSNNELNSSKNAALSMQRNQKGQPDSGPSETGSDHPTENAEDRGRGGKKRDKFATHHGQESKTGEGRSSPTQGDSQRRPRRGSQPNAHDVHDGAADGRGGGAADGRGGAAADGRGGAAADGRGGGAGDGRGGGADRNKFSTRHGNNQAHAEKSPDSPPDSPRHRNAADGFASPGPGSSAKGDSPAKRTKTSSDTAPRRDGEPDSPRTQQRDGDPHSSHGSEGHGSGTAGAQVSNNASPNTQNRGSARQGQGTQRPSVTGTQRPSVTGGTGSVTAAKDSHQLARGRSEAQANADPKSPGKYQSNNDDAGKSGSTSFGAVAVANRAELDEIAKKKKMEQKFNAVMKDMLNLQTENEDIQTQIDTIEERIRKVKLGGKEGLMKIIGSEAKEKKNVPEKNVQMRKAVVNLQREVNNLRTKWWGTRQEIQNIVKPVRGNQPVKRGRSSDTDPNVHQSAKGAHFEDEEGAPVTASTLLKPGWSGAGAGHAPAGRQTYAPGRGMGASDMNRPLFSINGRDEDLDVQEAAGRTSGKVGRLPRKSMFVQPMSDDSPGSHGMARAHGFSRKSMFVQRHSDYDDEDDAPVARLPGLPSRKSVFQGMAPPTEHFDRVKKDVGRTPRKSVFNFDASLLGD